MKKLQSQVRISGRDTLRRQKRIVRLTQAIANKKLQASLKKLSVNIILRIEEVNMI